ncbi:MAG: hypothetical protein NC938_06175 [Candidatus Omnitrophica bacterium]|nr:hypothetical protein [Candidatus Omnitrophota bacterium]
MQRICRIALIVLLVYVFSAVAIKAKGETKVSSEDLGAKTVNVVTDTTKSAVNGSANIAKSSVTNTVSTPITAIKAVGDTGTTALVRADKVLKTLTGEDKEGK